MARVKNHTKVKEPIRLRMKPLSDGSKSLYLDIYRDGKRTYEYLKMYIIPETDNNARRQNQATMDAANAIKSKRIIELTSIFASIDNRVDDLHNFLIRACIFRPGFGFCAIGKQEIAAKTIIGSLLVAK